jgi:S1-C subfamily serine protease
MGENTTDIKGVLVEDAIDGYPAAEAGIIAGDIITAVDGIEVESSFELVARLLRYEPGDTVTITINRDGQISDLNLILAARPVQTEG